MRPHAGHGPSGSSDPPQPPQKLASSGLSWPQAEHCMVGSTLPRIARGAAQQQHRPRLRRLEQRARGIDELPTERLEAHDEERPHRAGS
jgi:hypothetical protein